MLLKFAKHSIVVVSAMIFFAGCKEPEPGPQPHLSPNEVYPTDIKVPQLGFGRRVAGSGDMMFVGGDEGIYVFKRSAGDWSMDQFLRMEWGDIDVSDDHAAISYLADRTTFTFKTDVYSLAGSAFTFQTTIVSGGVMAVGKNNLIVGSDGSVANIYREINGNWELSGTVARPEGSNPLVGVDIDDVYAFTGGQGATNYIVQVYKFEEGTWQTKGTIQAADINFVMNMEANDEYVAVSSDAGLEIYRVENLAEPPAIIPMRFSYISDIAIRGSHVLVTDFDLSFVPEYRTTGEVRLYTLSAGAPSLVNTFVTDNSYWQDQYGNAIALTGKWALVSCTGDMDAGIVTGSVYFYSY